MGCLKGEGEQERIVNACVHNLNWTHFRCLLRVSDEDARMWYLNEAAKENWTYRTLDRNIGTQYYYWLLQAPKKEVVIAEMKQKTAAAQKLIAELCPNGVGHKTPGEARSMAW